MSSKSSVVPKGPLVPKKPPSPYSFDVESPIKNKNIKYILSIIVLLFVAGGIATLIFLLINTNNNDDTNDDI